MRRRRQNDITTLINALGGQSVIPALYDVRYGVTTALSGTVVSSWADARGASGFAPAVTATGTKRPAWDGTALTITFDGADDCLATGVNALFDVSGAYSIVLVGAMLQDAASGFPLSIADSTSANRFLGIKNSSGASGPIGVQVGGTATDSSVIISTTRRVAIAGKDGGSTSKSIDVPNAARAFSIYTAQAAGTNAFSVGNVFTGATSPAACVVRAAFCLTRQVTASDISATLAWAVAIHGAVAA